MPANLVSKFFFLLKMFPKMFWFKSLTFSVKSEVAVVIQEQVRKESLIKFGK